MDGQGNECEALVHILTDPTAEPIMLSYRFLEDITNKFSKDLEIGTGGFGVVYMGVVQNMKVAVKKLSRIDDFSEKQFEDELKCLKRVKHRNIVRFLGYCSETPQVVVEYKGAYVLAECRKRFLCFEYVPNKSLEDYIEDESRQHDWDTRYHLIEGICQGLHYLHNKERINHLDLKPANILLDSGMVPKITDFGLSRRFSGEQSRIITEHVRGTPGYIAPEYIDKGEISFKTDIYSLGIIIRKLLMGRNNDIFDLEGWQKSEEIVCPRAKICIKIAQLCVDPNQQRRPTIDNIIDMLNLKETLKVFSLEQKRSNSIQLPRLDPGEMHIASKQSSSLSKLSDEVQSTTVSTPPLDNTSSNGASSSLSKLTGEVQSMMVSTPALDNTSSNEIERNDKTSKVTDIYSHEFCFPFKAIKRLHGPMTLTNVTDHYVGIWITPISSLVNKSLLKEQCSFFVMKPNSTWVTTVTTKEHHRIPSRDTLKFKMTITIMGLDNSESPNGSLLNSMCDLLKLVINESGGKLTKAMVSAGCKILTTHQTKPPRTPGDFVCMAIDVHPTEPWIIMGYDGGLISIWNYKTQQRVKEAFKMTTCGVCSVKFIAKRDQWFAVAAGDAKGWIHVFNNSCFEGNKKVEAFEAHPDKYVDSLAVHPTYPILLSSSCEDSIIKRWDWDQGWACTQTFEGHTSGVRCLAFNPMDTNSFDSIGVDDDSKVWNINSYNAITPSPVVESEKDYFLNDRRHLHLLISCDNDQNETAEVCHLPVLWDLQTKDHLQTLGVFMRTKPLKNYVRAKDRDRGSSSEKKSGHASEIPARGQIKKESAKNNGEKDSDTKENHGGRGDYANNPTGASGQRGAGSGADAGNPGNKGQIGGAPTSKPIGFPRHQPPSGTATDGLYYQAGGGTPTYTYHSMFSDENPNSCSVM